jgi:hypothetical protein
VTDGSTFVVEQRDGQWSGWLLYCRTQDRDRALGAISYLVRHVGVDRCRLREIAPASVTAPRLGPDARLLLLATVAAGHMATSTAARLFGPARDAGSRRRASAAITTLRRHDLIATGASLSVTIPTAQGRRVAALLDDGDDDANT